MQTVHEYAYVAVQWHNAQQLAEWCLWYLAVNYCHVYTTCAKLLHQLEPRNQIYLTNHRWPPAWSVSVPLDYSYL